MEMEQSLIVDPSSTADPDVDLISELKAVSSTESKFSSLTLLIVTVILFFSSQIISLNWQEILILIGVLFFHELGHLAAMKLFKYRDVKMFFIPFLGAAVTGKNRNDTAVKSCIVSLMGPMPGIVLGLILYYMFFLTRNFYLFKAAQVMLLLNAFNLLPIMPLDGGRCIDVMFVNRRYFRFLFAFLGAAVFLLLAISASDFILGLFVFFTIYGALTNFKLHGISADLKAQGIEAHSVDQLLDDEASARIVIERIRAGYPKFFQPKIHARSIFNLITVIVDTLKFIPAKLLPKIALLTGYLVLVSTAVIFTFVVMAANYTEKRRSEEVAGEESVYSERYMFGKKLSECPVNTELYYDGKGTAFGASGVVKGVFYYANGYRTGEWLMYDESGQVNEKKAYDQGRLLAVSKLENGAWRTYALEDLPLQERISEMIQYRAQPFRSNYEYF